MISENAPQEMRSWTEARWWLLAASVFSMIAAVCVAFLEQIYSWGGPVILVALGTLPFIAESLIQFRRWWRRVLWIGAGVITGALILSEGGSVIFLIPAALEFIAASRRRNRPWAWLILTPMLFGLSRYWLPPLLHTVDRLAGFVAAQMAIFNGPASGLYLGAAIFGTVLFTRAIAGSFIATRKQPIAVPLDVAR